MYGIPNPFDYTDESIGAMFLHSLLIGVGGYVLMRAGKQGKAKAYKNSIKLGGAAFAYMGLFGHGLPTALRGPIAMKLIA